MLSSTVLVVGFLLMDGERVGDWKSVWEGLSKEEVGSIPSLLFPDSLARALKDQPCVMGLTECLVQATCFPNSKLSLQTL